jgi:hypothetical protein
VRWEEGRGNNDFPLRTASEFLRSDFSSEKRISISKWPANGIKSVIVRCGLTERRQSKDFIRKISICWKSIVAIRIFFSRLN